ncbi:ABC transporter ATP-binding protein [Aestuariispira insulae]|uniref:Multiple sugar transport system ATP-binding protein/multiple sugar transport system ATP-binding protein n=1 Tax=Aestuariispira insulae TaxID=1461337 RepID=A0A3D9HA95_9PROT|nr:ABC transporter ATP-binding protein [Aestuariispira insulae]RED46101.1 multiple sugar transport system ATP-binding protein/multiple sugar transport system ATP-binding protein [Aestuariispira insulae]
MTGLTLKQVNKKFGEFPVIHEVDLSIDSGELVVFVGPSGCGKSTLLRLIAGLEDITSGEFWIGGQRADQLLAAARNIAMVFQSYALYPHMTVAENIGFPLKLAKLPRARIAEKVAAVGESLRLGALFDRKPGQLSGGQRQRVAIGRALARDPKVLLLDEPLSNLDAALRLEMRMELSRLHKQLAATMVYVTHDQVEAMTLADRIVIMREGKVEQVGTPLELYSRPANVFVAEFIGSPKMNVFSADLDRSGGNPVIRLSEQTALSAEGAAGSRVFAGIRPEHMTPVDDGGLRGVVTAVEHLGADTLVHFDSAFMEGGIARINGISGVRTGENIGFQVAAEQYHLFSENGNRL